MTTKLRNRVGQPPASWRWLYDRSVTSTELADPDLPGGVTVNLAPLSRTEALIAWSTAPEGMDRDAMESIDRHGWGIER
jgi:hypothetical protein